MKKTHDILCAGSVLWDVIGRTPHDMRVGSDEPGRITRLPGGVAMNIAMTLRRFDLVPALLTAVGEDREGQDLMARCAEMGMITDHVHRAARPTDRYMAIEGPSGLIAAIADAHSLEAAGDAILTPLEDGTLGSTAAPYPGIVALDGNLTLALLAEIAARPSFAAADLRVAPASPGKARRLKPLMSHPGATLYVNREEAGLLTNTAPTTAAEGAEALLGAGATRVLVTDGGGHGAEGHKGRVISAPCPAVEVTRITGAGDTFMAAHIAAEHHGKNATEALVTALNTAAEYVAGADA